MIKYILITGAAKRLGRSIACRLAQDGWSLILHYNTSEKEVLSTQEECYTLTRKESGDTAQFFHIIQGRFDNDEDMNSFIQKFKSWPIIGIVNNVGAFFPGLASNLAVAEAKMMFQLNFFSPLMVIQALIPRLKENQLGGSIINIGTAGLLRFSADTYAPYYHASKQALLYLTKSLAKELASSHISVNMVSPGKLDISVDAEDASHTIPYGRLGFSSEVSEVVAFLMQSKNAYITGQNIEISGGFCL
ncbi:MAG: SDR family oxidoreductase [Chlamydia sp.]